MTHRRVQRCPQRRVQPGHGGRGDRAPGAGVLGDHMVEHGLDVVGCEFVQVDAAEGRCQVEADVAGVGAASRGPDPAMGVQPVAEPTAGGPSSADASLVAAMPIGHQRGRGRRAAGETASAYPQPLMAGPGHTDFEGPRSVTPHASSGTRGPQLAAVLASAPATREHAAPAASTFCPVGHRTPPGSDVRPAVASRIKVAWLLRPWRARDRPVVALGRGRRRPYSPSV